MNMAAPSTANLTSNVSHDHKLFCKTDGENVDRNVTRIENKPKLQPQPSDEVELTQSKPSSIFEDTFSDQILPEPEHQAKVKPVESPVDLNYPLEYKLSYSTTSNHSTDNMSEEYWSTSPISHEETSHFGPEFKKPNRQLSDGYKINSKEPGELIVHGKIVKDNRGPNNFELDNINNVEEGPVTPVNSPSPIVNNENKQLTTDSTTNNVTTNNNTNFTPFDMNIVCSSYNPSADLIEIKKGVDDTNLKRKSTDPVQVGPNTQTNPSIDNTAKPREIENIDVIEASGHKIYQSNNLNKKPNTIKGRKLLLMGKFYIGIANLVEDQEMKLKGKEMKLDGKMILQSALELKNRKNNQ